MKKRGVSPVVATVLLIGLVVVLSTVVLIWFRGFANEANFKFGKNIALSCNDVVFEASYQGGELAVSNQGNVPIYNFEVKVNGEGGNFQGNDLKSMVTSSWGNGISAGGAFSSSLKDGSLDGAVSITLIPILRGSTKGGALKSYTCDSPGRTVTV